MLFDTDVVIWALRGKESAAAKIDAETQRQLSVVSYMELLKGARNKSEQQLVKRFVHDLGFDLLPIDDDTSNRAVIYMEDFVLSSGLDIADALIAATAAEHNCRLCTANDRHYRVIPGLAMDVFRP
jgi:predicted nucleic acid-binding protein